MQALNRILYGTLSTIAFPLAILFASTNRKLRIDLKERLLGGGWSGVELERCIWIHAASVGELQGVTPLIAKIRSKTSDPIVVTTTSLTGREKARTLPGIEYSFLVPYDHPILISLLIRKIRPRLFLLFETELWPNLLLGLEKFKVPVVLINGRISDKTFPQYLRFNKFVRPLLNSLNICLVQSSKDKTRFEVLGAKNVRVDGSTKYDAAISDISDSVAKLLTNLQCPSDSDLLVCGSVRPGESDIILGAAKRLFSQFKNLKIFIAPRHPDQFEIEAGNALNAGFKVSKRSDPKPGAQVFVLDSLGELKTAYAASTIAFVGGTLVNIGGHNPMEPALFSKPILIGPYTQNVEEITSELVDSGGAIRVGNESQFSAEVQKLLMDNVCRNSIGANAFKVLKGHSGAVERVINEITPLLEYSGVSFKLFDGTRLILKTLEIIYRAVTDIRNYFYDTGILKSYKSSLPVICVGNATVGGNAKSPVTQTIAKLLIQEGLTPVILLRGYSGSESGPIEVNDASAVKRFGDEACMHKSTLQTVPVVVSRSRSEGAEFIEWQKLGNVIVLDDGFQHRALRRDLNLLLFDSNSIRQAEQGELLPLGRLRESLTGALKRADGVFLIERGETLNRPTWIGDKLKVFNLPLVFSDLQSVNSGKTIEWSDLQGKSVSAVATIAKPIAFKNMIEDKGVKVLSTIFKSDHAFWSSDDVPSLNSLPGDFILTTAKDLSKLKSIPALPDRLLVANLAVETPTDLSKWILTKLNQ